MDDVVADRQASLFSRKPVEIISSRRGQARQSAIMPLWHGRFRRPARALVLRPIGVAGAWTLIALVIVWVVPGLIDSSARRKEHRASVHSDRSAVETGVTESIERPITLVYRDVNGTLHRILADETETNRFVNDTLLYLDAERSRIKAETEKEIAALFETAFFDRQDAISDYADWYFDPIRSWALLKEALAGGINGVSINNVQGITEASRNEVEAYLIRNYQRFVLKPELRNPIIEEGISRVLANAHTRYLTVLTTIELRAQLFLSKFTRHLEVIDPHSKLNVALDWDAQKWKAPRYAIDDEAFEAILRGTKLMAVSWLLGRTVGPPIESALSGIFMTTANRALAIVRPQIVGFVTGSAVEPGAGSLAGWLIGAGGALAIDYVFTKYHENVSRADFENASVEALNVTIREWSRAIERDLFRAIDVWFEDTRMIVAEQKIRRN